MVNYDKSKIWKAKEWLFDNDLIGATGKGRMSADHHLALQDAYDNGVRFSNWEPKNVALMVTEKTDKATGAVTETVSAKRIDNYSTGEIEEIAPYLWQEDTHTAYELELNGKGKRVKRSLREVCRHCRVSLVQCNCGAPEIVANNGRGHVRVEIVSLKAGV